MLYDRLKIVINHRLWSFFKDGIIGNIVMLPTAYFHQIPNGDNIKANPELKKKLFSQYTSKTNT